MSHALRSIAALLVIFTAACGDKPSDAAASGSSAPSGAAAAAGGQKTCPDGAPLCFTLPAGFTAKNPQSGGWGGSIDISDESKKKTATILWAKPETYASRLAQTESTFKAGEDPKTEKILDGKGVYYESKDKSQDVHWFQSVVQGDSHAWQCTGRQPKADGGTELASICKSLTAK